MPRDKKGRNANGRSSIFQSPTDGAWHGWVSVGAKDDGRPDRRHVRGRTKAEVTRKVNLLERERDEGKTRKAGQTWTVEQWLNHWLEAIIAPPTITENAYDAYEVAVRVHLIPGVGGHRIDRLEPEHLERLYRKLVPREQSPAARTRRIERCARRWGRRNVAVRSRRNLRRSPVHRRSRTRRSRRTRWRRYSGFSSCGDKPEQCSMGCRAGARASTGRSARADVGRRESRRRDARRPPESAPSQVASRVRQHVRSQASRLLPLADRCADRYGGNQVTGGQAWDGSARPAHRTLARAPSAAGRRSPGGMRSLAGHRLRLHDSRRSPDQPEHGLSRVEATTREGRCSGAAPPRLLATRPRPSSSCLVCPSGR